MASTAQGNGSREMDAQSAGGAADLSGARTEHRWDSGLGKALSDDKSTIRKSRNRSITPHQDSETAP